MLSVELRGVLFLSSRAAEESSLAAALCRSRRLESVEGFKMATEFPVSLGRSLWSCFGDRTGVGSSR